MSESQPPADDFVVAFQVEGAPVRGRLVRLGETVDTILTRHDYPDVVSALLGEATALTAMLGAALKFEGKLILQTRGDGPLSMLVSDYASDGALRAYAAIDAEFSPDMSSAGALVGRGHMALTIDQGPDMDRYQGVTPLEGDSLTDWALGYFAQSEQIPTALKLAVGRVQTPGGPEQWRAGGVLVQLVPEEGGERGVAAPATPDAEDDWTRASLLLETAQADELLDPTLAPNDLLYRLYHEDGVRVFPPKALRFACGCSRAKIERVLVRYPREELREMAEDGLIRATCEFCNETYVFEPDLVGNSAAEARSL